MANGNAEATECACRDCKCEVQPADAVMRDGKAYCCEACANGHKDHAGCEHAGCGCHG